MGGWVGGWAGLRIAYSNQKWKLLRLDGLRGGCFMNCTEQSKMAVLWTARSSQKTLVVASTQKKHLSWFCYEIHNKKYTLGIH
jgi:hypothetical protein